LLVSLPQTKPSEEVWKRRRGEWKKEGCNLTKRIEIHGWPYRPWDNVQATPGNENTGYCHHVSVLFPTWHRPYLALFEVCFIIFLSYVLCLDKTLMCRQQVLYNHIQAIASYYPAGEVRNRYVDAAVEFRMPYWDWALTPSSSQSVFPSSVQDPAAVVNGPAGPQTIANPLFSYGFHSADPNDLPDPLVSDPSRHDSPLTSPANPMDHHPAGPYITP